MNESIIQKLSESVIRGNQSDMTLLYSMFEKKQITDYECGIIFKSLERAIDNDEDIDGNIISNIAVMYYYGMGVQRNFHRTRNLLEIAIAKGNFDAVNYLGFMYERGSGVEKDYEQARKLYELAISKGYFESIFNLAVMYRNGLGVNQDYKKARELYELSISKGSDKCSNNLGILYDLGLGVDSNYIKAYELYEKALQTDRSSITLYNMATLFEEGGYGIERNIDKAKLLYQEAADKGFKKAEKKLQKWPFI